MGNFDIIKFLKKVFCLPPLPTVLIAIPSYALVFWVLYSQTTNFVLANISYVLSAYAFIITITGFTGIVTVLKDGFWELKIIKLIRSTKFGYKFLESMIFRSAVSLHQGLAINILYVALKIVTGIMYRSVWLIAFGIYYLLLAIMRGILVHYVHQHEIGEDTREEYVRYRYCGILLLFMNQALAGIVVYIVHKNQGVTYPGLLIYGMALYAFYSITVSIINVVKFRKVGSPIMSTAKVISLTASCVSMLSLETAMLAQFGGNDYTFRKIMTSISGGVVCTFVLGMAIYMIIRSTKYLKNV